MTLSVPDRCIAGVSCEIHHDVADEVCSHPSPVRSAICASAGFFDWLPSLRCTFIDLDLQSNFPVIHQCLPMDHRNTYVVSDSDAFIPSRRFVVRAGD